MENGIRQQKGIVDSYFHREHCDNERYYDCCLESDINKRIRNRFNCFRQNPHVPMKVVDGVGHISDCPYDLIEVTMSDIDKSINQIEETAKKILESQAKVNKIILVLHLGSWNNYLSKVYEIREQMLYMKETQDFVQIRINEITYNIFCYLEDFYNYY